MGRKEGERGIIKAEQKMKRLFDERPVCREVCGGTKREFIS